MKASEITVCPTSHGPLLMAVWRNVSPLVDGCYFPDAERFLRRFCEDRHIEWVNTYSEGDGVIGGRSAVYAWALVRPYHAAALQDVPERKVTHNTLVLAELLSRDRRPTSVEVWALWEDTYPHDHCGVERRSLPDDMRHLSADQIITKLPERGGYHIRVEAHDPSILIASVPWWRKNNPIPVPHGDGS